MCAHVYNNQSYESPDFLNTFCKLIQIYAILKFNKHLFGHTSCPT